MIKKINLVKGEKMSKFLKLLFVAIVGVSFASTAAFADAGKGQKLFIKEMKGTHLAVLMVAQWLKNILKRNGKLSKLLVN